MKKTYYKDRMKIFEIGYICVLIAIFLIEFIGLVKSGDIDISGSKDFVLNINNIGKLLSTFFFILIFVLVKSITKIVGITAIYIGIKIAIKKYKKEKNKINDYENNKTFYRDILKEYSPGVLNYIKDLSVNYNTIFITLMSLENKGVITFDEDIKVINDNPSSLDNSERYVLDAIKSNTLKKISVEEFKKVIEEECLSNELVKNKRDGVKKLRRISIFCIIFYILNFIVFVNSANIFNHFDINNQFLVLLSFLISLLMMLIIIILPEALIVYVVYYFY